MSVRSNGRGARAARSRTLRAVLVTATAALLAGCVSIPNAGPVQVGLTDLKQADQVYQYKPPGPIAGASQEDLVRGFVLAATSSADEYATAREFLTTGYANQWDPNSGVLIDEGSRPYRADGDTTGVLSLAVSAKVDAAGEMLPVAPGPSMEMRFEFERVGAEWRISSAPNGIILDATMFSTIWSPHQLYFIGAGNLLVPETRWFLTRSSLATEIVGALLEGPSEGMREVVRSGFPSGTALAKSSVPVVEGSARIDLTSHLLEAQPVALAELRQQLKSSLQSVPGVTGFELLVDGTPLRANVGDEANAPRMVSVPSTPAVMIDDEFGSLVAGELRAVPPFGSLIHELDPDAVSLALDERAAAVRHPGGVSRVDENGSVLIDARPKLLEPSFDPLGYIWTASAEHPEQLIATGPAGESIAVAAPWLAGRTPTAVRVSPDGSRVAALVSDGDESAVLMSGIVRDETGAPLRTVPEADTKLWVSGTPLDLDWVGQLRFAALTRVGTAGKVTLGGLGSFGSEQTSVQGGIRVSGGGGKNYLRVLSSGGELFAPQGSGWQEIDEDVSILAKRG